MASSEETESNAKTLANMFQEGLDLYNYLDKLTEPTNSPNVQSSVKKAMRIFEDVTRLVSSVGMFSSNERFEEIATTDLQYLLLPALLGSLSLKLTTGDRNTIINAADVYFKDFLQRCNDYGLSDYDLKERKEDTHEEPKSQIEELRYSVNTRANKIERFRKQKELKEKLENLKTNVANENVDEEIKRDFFLTMIKLYIYEAIDELNSIEMEKPILEHMAKIGKDDKPKLKRPPPPLKPIIITKDAAQKAVFGAGYPSLPTMTVQEFYDKRVRDGIFPDPNKPQTTGMSLQEASIAGISLNDEEEENETQENLVEEDNPENIERMRARDEYKDDHRRGWGNRMNRS